MLLLTFSVVLLLVANPNKLFFTVANPARGLLNREKRAKDNEERSPPLLYLYRMDSVLCSVTLVLGSGSRVLGSGSIIICESESSVSYHYI